MAVKKSDVIEKLTAAGIEFDPEASLKELQALLPADEAVSEDGVIFVNREKRERAQIIVDLVSGKRVPKTEGEADLRDRFAGKFTEAEVNPKGKDALRFAYETLGGLVRTPAEQDEANKKANVQRAKNKRTRVQE